jgi:hypothetical protein
MASQSFGLLILNPRISTFVTMTLRDFQPWFTMLSAVLMLGVAPTDPLHFHYAFPNPFGLHALQSHDCAGLDNHQSLSKDSFCGICSRNVKGFASSPYRSNVLLRCMGQVKILHLDTVTLQDPSGTLLKRGPPVHALS